MLNLDLFQKAMKRAFPDLAYMVASKSRLFKLFSKKGGYKGDRVWWRPIVDATNGSNGFVESRAYAGGPTPLEGGFGFKRDYVHVKLDNELMLASQGEGASEPAQVVLTKSALKTHALQVKLGIIRGGGNNRGKIASGITTATITLVNKEDAIFFLPGMWLVASSDDGAQASPAGTRSGNAAVQIGSVNIQKGTLTTKTGTTWDTAIPAIATSDWLFRLGDYGLTGPNAFYGLAAWFPREDPGASDSFGGVNRSTAPDKLAGMRVPVSGNLVRAIIATQAELQKNLDGDDETPLTCILSLTRAQELVEAVQSQGIYMPPGDKAVFGASSFQFRAPWGVCNVVAETGLEQDLFYVGVADEFEIIYRHGDIPHWFNGDGREWRHLGDSDSIEAFLQSYVCTRCQHPERWAIGVFDT